MNWIRSTQLNKLGVSTSLPNLLPKFFGLSLPILVCSVRLACTEIQKDMLIKLQNQRPRRWVRDWVGRRGGLGASNTLLRELAEEDPDEYRNAIRMDTSKFEELLSMVASKVQKQDTVMRPAISSKTKLEVTLRYLATGDSFCSLGLMFQVPHNTIFSFLPDVLAAIYDSLYPFIKVCGARIILIDTF